MKTAFETQEERTAYIRGRKELVDRAGADASRATVLIRGGDHDDIDNLEAAREKLASALDAVDQLLEEDAPAKGIEIRVSLDEVRQALEEIRDATAPANPDAIAVVPGADAMSAEPDLAIEEDLDDDTADEPLPAADTDSDTVPPTER